jgi:Na+:H+ antiporter, NhaA family
MNIPPRSLGSVKVQARRSWVARRVTLPIQGFVYTAGLGSIVLLAAVVIALAWTNSPWHASYERVWTTRLVIELGRFAIRLDVRDIINDGLMAIFFFIAGIEIKREWVEGDLSNIRRATLPVASALGGMVVPALIYTAFSGPGPASRGWGIPMATDIAFAVGVLLLLGKRVPVPLRTFLLALAVADDLGAILVIAIFYTATISLIASGAALLFLGIIVLMRWGGMRGSGVYILVALLFWLAVHSSGVHATIAGVVLGLMTPSRPWFSLYAFSESIRKITRRFQRALDRGDFDRAEALMGQLEELSYGTEPPLDRRLRLLHPWSSFVILPLFALANSGVSLSSDILQSALVSRPAWGIALGLILGKPLGVVGFAWLAVRLRWATLPTGANWGHMIGAGLLAGIGFTVSLFITELAFDDRQQLAEAKISILVASVLAGVAGYVVSRWAVGRQPLVQAFDALRPASPASGKHT